MAAANTIKQGTDSSSSICSLFSSINIPWNTLLYLERILKEHSPQIDSM